MVKGMPEPVWPYAKMQALKPSAQDLISGVTCSHTSSYAGQQCQRLSLNSHRRAENVPDMPPCASGHATESRAQLSQDLRDDSRVSLPDGLLHDGTHHAIT